MNKRGEGNYTAEGINAIAAALHVSASLTSINLKQNKLGDEGWGAILAGACANKDSKIASINMSSEGISLAGAKLIGEALRTSVSTSLTQVLAFCSFAHRCTLCYFMELPCPCFYSLS